MRQWLYNWTIAPAEYALLQLPRAFVASVLALLLDLGVYTVLVEILYAPPVAANIISYLVGCVLQYYLCSWWVFSGSPRNHAVGFATFTVLSLVGLGLSCAVIYGLYDLAQTNEFAAKVASVGLTFAWNFLSRKYLLFNAGRANDHRRPETAESGMDVVPPLVRTL